MTKKDFELIANIVKGLNYPQGPLKAIHTTKVAIRFSKVLADKNPKFNSDKFLIACGLKKVI